MSDWNECWNCDGEGYSHHDCGEDVCPCLHPEDDMRCDICEGDGGWWDEEDEDDLTEEQSERFERLRLIMDEVYMSEMKKREEGDNQPRPPVALNIGED